MVYLTWIGIKNGISHMDWYMKMVYKNGISHIGRCIKVVFLTKIGI